jgi:hypothetical protein
MDIYFGDHQIWSTLSLLIVPMLWVTYIIVGMVDKFVIIPQENHE